MTKNQTINGMADIRKAYIGEYVDNAQTLEQKLPGTGNPGVQNQS